MLSPHCILTILRQVHSWTGCTTFVSRLYPEGVAWGPIVSKDYDTSKERCNMPRSLTLQAFRTVIDGHHFMKSKHVQPLRSNIELNYFNSILYPSTCTSISRYWYRYHMALYSIHQLQTKQGWVTSTSRTLYKYSEMVILDFEPSAIGISSEI